MSAMPNSSSSSNTTAILCTIYAHLMHLIFIFIFHFFSSSSVDVIFCQNREKMVMKSAEKMSAMFKESKQFMWKLY